MVHTIFFGPTLSAAWSLPEQNSKHYEQEASVFSKSDGMPHNADVLRVMSLFRHEAYLRRKTGPKVASKSPAHSEATSTYPDRQVLDF